jgi:hypothetical protein
MIFDDLLKVKDRLVLYFLLLFGGTQILLGEFIIQVLARKYLSDIEMSLDLSDIRFDHLLEVYHGLLIHFDVEICQAALEGSLYYLDRLSCWV